MNKPKSLYELLKMASNIYKNFIDDLEHGPATPLVILNSYLNFHPECFTENINRLKDNPILINLLKLKYIIRNQEVQLFNLYNIFKNSKFWGLSELCLLYKHDYSWLYKYVFSKVNIFFGKLCIKILDYVEKPITRKILKYLYTNKTVPIYLHIKRIEVKRFIASDKQISNNLHQEIDSKLLNIYLIYGNKLHSSSSYVEFFEIILNHISEKILKGKFQNIINQNIHKHVYINFVSGVVNILLKQALFGEYYALKFIDVAVPPEIRPMFNITELKKI